YHSASQGSARHAYRLHGLRTNRLRQDRGNLAVGSDRAIVLHILSELCAALIALSRVLRQAFSNYCTKTWMDGYFQLAWRNRVLVSDLVDDRGYVLSSKRTFPRRHFIEHNPETEQVGAPVEIQSLHLLRRHIVWRAQHLATMRHASRGLGDAEIHDLGHILARDHDVGRLDIAVNDLHSVRIIKSSGYLLCNLDDLVARNDPLF